MKGFVFEQAIKKYKLLDVANYGSEDDFDEAVSMFASSIKVLPEYYEDNNNGDITSTTD